MYYGALLLLTLLFTAYEELSLRRRLFQHFGGHSMLAGSLPNFLAALLFGLFFLMLKPPVNAADRLRPVLLSVIGLSLYEVAQIWMPHRVFDWNDLAATVLGGALCWLLASLPVAAKRGNREP